jgi:hypothetical protein
VYIIQKTQLKGKIVPEARLSRKKAIVVSAALRERLDDGN